MSDGTPNIYDLWKMVWKHPDYIGGVIFTTDDVENAATGTDRDASKMDTARAMKDWEDGACNEGMEALIECAIDTEATILEAS